MNQLNKVGPEHIKQLGAEQLVRLLHLLLHAEAKDRLLAKHGIHVPFQINVPDGGRDGKWDADIGANEYIPKKLTYYQCKAQNLTVGDCRSEILRNDEKDNIRLKEKVEEVLNQGGAYFGGEMSLTRRRAKLSDALHSFHLLVQMEVLKNN
jgi:hypothetical protein